jgi:hypothetical protein
MPSSVEVIEERALQFCGPHIGEIVLSVVFLADDKTPTFMFCCSNLFAIANPDFTSIAVQILQHFDQSEKS